MPLPITIPNTFANATATIPLSQLDNNFATLEVAVNSIGNGAFSLANVQVTGGTIANVTLDNVSVDVETLSNVTITNLTVDGNATFTNAAVTANTATITTANVTTANVTNMVTGNATITGGTVNVSSVVSTANVSVGDDLIFTGTGNRITGDFSNATVANRVMFQSSTTNGNTIVSALPNGTATTSGFRAYNNSDLSNNANLIMSIDGTLASIQSQAVGTGTYLPMTFYTGGSERMRIDTSGNVGIGTSSPATILNAYSATNASFNLDGDSTVAIRASRYSTDTSQSAFQFRKARGTLASPTAVASGDATGDISFQAYGGSNFRTTASVQSLVETYTSDTNIAGYLVFSTNGGSTSATERARIDSSGNLLVGKTVTSVGTAGFEAKATGMSATNSGAEAANFNRNTSDGTLIIFRRSSTGVGTISVTTTATAYNTSSDYRLKHDIQPMTGALAKVQQLRPVTYKWNSDNNDGEGFIAHELAEVCPQAVTGEKDAVDADGNPIYQGIDTSFLVATLTAALQEAHGLIKDLQARVNALEAK